MSDSQPGTHELQRRIDGLESTVAANRAEQKTDQAEIKSDMSAGFDRVMDRLERLDFVSPQFFQESQRRQDAERERQDNEITWLRRLIVGGFGAVLAGGAAVQYLGVG